ncbi:vitelline membrane outer layer protein 1 homolog [Varanus komodoensis]|uniref:vitelline membrane outer layer protein 1 homolog n=1 Tax=Varanus komodoensis TaxID=61221 RepID=UPI001CF7E4A1|nr:vitelline membrane outer layer protein 1 homolog [Varanus komodoensis]
MQALSAVLFLALVCFTSAFDKRIVRANATFANRASYSSISVANGGRWGEWTWTEMCPEGSYATGFSIKVKEYGGGAFDDTALNGIRLFCSTEQTSHIMYTIESKVGDFGHWSGVRWCPRNGVLQSFQLQVEPEQGALYDDTAVNNIKFRCSNGVILEESGGPFGAYSEWSKPCLNGGICGIQTKQEPYQGPVKDDTALNDVRLFCCQ